MKDKVLLGSVVLSICLAINYQTQMRQTVSAETKESTVSQKETTPSSVASSAVSEANEESEKSTVSLESSSIEESRSSEIVHSASSTTRPSESERLVEESTTSATALSEAVVKAQTPLPAEKVEENYQFSVVKNQTTEGFIQTIGADAQKIAWEEGLYASVMIAQAILETGSGNSQLARPPHHNLFGIKGSYQGKNVSFHTQEDKGNGQLYTVQSAFRQYPTYKESIEDYATLLKQGISGNATFYQATWKENALTYQMATKALTGKYATDTSYDKKLNALIEAYHLTRYDVEPGARETGDVSETSEISSENKEVSVNQIENEVTEASAADEPTIIKSQMKQPVIIIPPVTHRPAKEVAGNRRVQ